MEEVTTLKLFEQAEELFNLYSNGLITPQYYKEAMSRLKKVAEDIDKEKRDSERKILKLEAKAAEADTDPLMEIYAKRILLNHPLTQGIPTDTTFVMCDIDNFGGINNRYGHPIGDEILKVIGQKIRKVIKRGSDLIIRYGGDEIVIILPNCPPEKAEEKCAEIRALVVETVRSMTFKKISDEEPLTVKNISIEEPLTISFGIYHRTDEELSIQDSIDLADVASYYSKEHKKGIDNSGITIYSPGMPKVRG